LSEGILKSSAFPKEDQDCGGGSWAVRAVDTKERGKGTGDSTSSENQEKQLGEGPAEAKTTCAPTH
jgi:hypothetical protein